MIELYFETDPDKLPAISSDVLPVRMFGKSALEGKYNSIGGAALQEFRRLQEQPDEIAFDLMMLSLAVTAADTFVERNTKAEDAWCRQFKIHLPLLNPDLWQQQRTLLEEALHFLSGDLWDFKFSQSDFQIPSPITNRRARKIHIDNHDSVCLFSGGLDSTIGAVDLKEQGKKPVLVSHAYPKDREKQNDVYHQLGLNNAKFQVVANPRKIKEIPVDVQMRTRSFNFIAFGALIATALSKNNYNNQIITLYVPENGLISINPPLTARRIGSLSTRTTHPYFLGRLNELFINIGLPVKLLNPYQFKTKGEMIAECQNQTLLQKVAANTVSCGKWKRSGTQCGRCVPCLIRRASFNAAAYNDTTSYQFPVLKDVIHNPTNRDDLMSMIVALQSLEKAANKNIWVARSGFLPLEKTERQNIIDTVLRGMDEVKHYLQTQNLGVTI
ncbi:Qat anti-phage system QueC-like protein QatC [Moraxella sp. 179-F 1C4 NHS]|jgi:7-cyano-7-deazaguanine synthase in queuosine biosynthesis